LPTYRGAKTSLEYWVLVNSRFHTPKNFRKLSEIWAGLWTADDIPEDLNLQQENRELQIARLYGEVNTLSVVSGSCICDVV